MKRNTFIRVLCAALCAAVFLGTFTILFSAVDAAGDPTDEVAVTEEVTAEPAGGDDDGEEVTIAPPPAADNDEEVLETEVAAAPTASNPLTGVFDWFFRTFGFMGFTFDPYQFTIINQKPTFQWLLGFNDFYDTMPWVVNVWADTMKCHFNYEGKDWRVQFWKGGYGVFFATGGEIGIYNKSENQNLEHYTAPVSQGDWLDLTFSIYNKGNKLFTRPSPQLSGDVGPYWWATGYKILSICTDFLSRPRKNVVMDATLNFKSAAMAELFVGELEAKGFTELAVGDLGLGTPEKYQANGQSVRFIWQTVSEGIY